jgi:hypothetical protein
VWERADLGTSSVWPRKFLGHAVIRRCLLQVIERFVPRPTWHALVLSDEVPVWLDEKRPEGAPVPWRRPDHQLAGGF